MTPERVIGYDNALPWRIPEDLAHFKKLTMSHPIVMGRRTYESIGRPLPGRRNLVVTRNPDWRAAGVDVVHGLDAAIDSAAGAREIFVIGGAQLYALALPRATSIHLTTVHARVMGDTFFPKFESQRWRLVSRSALQRSKTGHLYEFSLLRAMT